MELKELVDGYFKSGDDIDKFRKEIAKLDKATECVPLGTSELTFLSYVGEGEEGKLMFLQFDPKSAGTGNDNAVVLSAAKTTEKNPEIAPLFEEMKRLRLMIRIDGRYRFVSSNAFYGLAKVIGFLGDGVHVPDHELFKLYAKRYGNDKDISLITRKCASGVTKIFSVFSDIYTRVPQTVMTDIIAGIEDEMGESKCVKWEVSHEETMIQLEFPEKAKDLAKTYRLPCETVPGVRIATSDVGRSSLTVTEIMRIDGSYLPAYVFKREHKGNINLGMLLDSISSRVFSNYTKLPERLCELASITINDPAAVIEHTAGRLDLERSLGKRLAKSFVEEMQIEAGDDPCTAYDIAVSFLTLPERYVAGGFESKDIKEKLATACYRAPFLEYKDPEKVVLA
jgi:hypothetical protein